MMAPHQSHGPTNGRFPSAETLALLRTVLAGYLAGNRTPADEEAVCDALRVLAAEARDRRLHGEHMLIAFKQLWSEMTEVAAISDSRQRQQLLNRLVKLCIDVYYQQG